MTRPQVGTLLAFSWLAAMVALMPFTAEDAYIVGRYAYHFVHHGELSFNLGERINALTSPLHVFVVAPLEVLGWDSVRAGKPLAALVVLATVALVAVRYRTALQVAVFALVALSPFTVLWTVGGLETPYVFAANLAAAALAVRLGEGAPCGYPLVIAVCLAVLFRPDAAVFWGPAWIVLAIRHRLLGPTALAASIGLAWLAATYAYFGDLLPTSFHVKTPSGTRWIPNLVYMAQLVILSGAAYLAAASPPSRAHFFRFAWAYAGLACFALYGLTAATTHMMYGYRLFVPLLGILAILAADAVQESRRSWIAVGALAIQSAVLVVLLATTTLNPGFVGEFRHVSARDAADFIAALAASGRDIARHAHDGATLQTGTEGVTPYQIPDVYVFGNLVSYRHQCKIDRSLSAAYVQVMRDAEGLARLRSEFEVVSVRKARLGQDFYVVVYRNPETSGASLPAKVGGECPHGKLAGR